LQSRTGINELPCDRQTFGLLPLILRGREDRCATSCQNDFYLKAASGDADIGRSLCYGFSPNPLAENPEPRSADRHSVTSPAKATLMVCSGRPVGCEYAGSVSLPLNQRGHTEKHAKADIGQVLRMDFMSTRPGQASPAISLRPTAR
jgi:hypothetical protein